MERHFGITFSWPSWTAAPLAGMLVSAWLLAIHSPICHGQPDAGSSNGGAARPLISGSQLQPRLGEHGLLVLDTRPETDFNEGHLPGAHHVDVEDWKRLSLADGGLDDAAGWGQRVGALGIVHGTTVVVYGGELNEAARIWWLLKYVGLADVRLLDGGFALWSSEGKPISSDPPSASTTDFQPRFDRGRLADLADVKHGLAEPGTAVLDARSAAEFTGREVRGPRGGHIPGAAHLEWKSLLDEQGRFKPRGELVRLFAGVGLSPEQMVVTHCQSGGRSSVSALALELAGFGRVKNYYCGWQQWSADPQAPVARPETTQPPNP